MNAQLISGAVVSVRWAKEDPNPSKVAALAAARTAGIVRVVTQATVRSPSLILDFGATLQFTHAHTHNRYSTQ